MISLQHRFASFPSGTFDFNASQDGKYGWFLLTWHPETDPVLEEIQTQIKLDIRNSALGQTSKLEIESWLKRFFGEYHWKLHAVFRKTNLKEKGISLFLAVMYDTELFILEFGRMLSGICFKDELSPAGRQWNNFHVKSLDEMVLLGMSENDIPVKPRQLHLAPENKLIVLPSVFTEKLLEQDVSFETVSTIMQSIFDETNGSFLILESKKTLLVKKKPKLRRYQISAIFIIVITIFAILYMQFGNRWLERTGKRVKLLLSSRNRLTFEQIPQYLNIQSENIKRQLEKIERIANQPARNIKFAEKWRTDFQFLITAAPAFDINNIYIASDKNLMAFNKQSKKLEWKMDFEEDVREISLVRGNLIVILENNRMISLRGGNNINWSYPLADKYSGRYSYTPFEINNDADPRIYGSILIVPAERGLYVHDVNNGELLSRIEFDKKLQYLSQYDAFDNCFYAVIADDIRCISLDILN